jgi:peptidyl-prolyl cis-trans isomerase D
LPEEILQEKVRQFLTTFLPVTEQEVLDLYTFANQKVKVSFVQFEPERFKDRVEIEEAAMEAYFEENKERYRTPEKIRVAYVTFDPESFKSALNVSEERFRITMKTISTPSKKESRSRQDISFSRLLRMRPMKRRRSKREGAGGFEKGEGWRGFCGTGKEYSEDAPLPRMEETWDTSRRTRW